MTNLIKQYSHGNQISVIKLLDERLIRKITFRKASYKYLISEFNGTKWYKLKMCCDKGIYPKLIQSNTFLQLDMNIIRGRSVYHLATIDKTKSYLYKVIEHYTNVWDRSLNAPCHGDLTLSNILFNRGNPWIIDWEHFNEDGEYWGFDLAYLILSSISLPFLNNQRVKDIHIEDFKSLWRELIFLGIDSEIIKKPFKYFNNIFQNKKIWKEIVNDSPKKLFTINIKKEFSNYIDENITSKI